MPSAKIIKALIVIAYPLVWLSELLTRCVSPKIQPLTVSREEVAAMVSVGTDEGVIEDAENKVIQSFLKLSNVKAEDIMTPYVVVSSVSTGTTMKEFYDNKAFAPFSRIPVFETGREFITGYVRRANVLEMLTQDKFTVQLKDIVRPILFFMEDAKVSDIWQRMLQEKEHISVITDEYGCMRGIVTMEDVIETMLGVEIMDECDTTENLQAMARKKFTPETARHM